MDANKTKHGTDSVEEMDIFYDYAVQHMEKTGTGCILYCTNGGRKYAEIIFEGMENSENEELLWYNRIKSIESKPVGKGKQKRHIIAYCETHRMTIICAENVRLYPSSYFICEAGRYAAAEWRKRHVCLPSVMTALLMLETNNGENIREGIRKLVRERTDCIAAWKADNAQKRKVQGEQSHYTAEAGYLQKSVPPYCRQEDLARLLIQCIEANGLSKFDP